MMSDLKGSSLVSQLSLSSTSQTALEQSRENCLDVATTAPAGEG